MHAIGIDIGGTKIAGALVSGGSLFRGGFGAGAELGHLRVVPGGIPCGRGARGCIEQYGSGRALLGMANEIADAGRIGLGLASARRTSPGCISRGASVGTHS